MDVSLDEFLTGIFAVLAFRERRKVLLTPGVFDVALNAALDGTAKGAARERLDVRFRIRKGALAGENSNLRRALRRLADAGVLVIPEDPETPAEIQWSKQSAYGWLAATPLPVGFLERAAKVFAQALETARIRSSLHRLAARKRTKA